jgi:hypothetical protein
MPVDALGVRRDIGPNSENNFASSAARCSPAIERATRFEIDAGGVRRLSRRSWLPCRQPSGLTGSHFSTTHSARPPRSAGSTRWRPRLRGLRARPVILPLATGGGRCSADLVAFAVTRCRPCPPEPTARVLDGIGMQPGPHICIRGGRQSATVTGCDCWREAVQRHCALTVPTCVTWWRRRPRRHPSQLDSRSSLRDLPERILVQLGVGLPLNRVFRSRRP